MEDKRFYDVKEVRQLCGCSQDRAYRLIRELNEEQSKKGMITFRGKVLKKYFEKRIGYEKS